MLQTIQAIITIVALLLAACLIIKWVLQGDPPAAPRPPKPEDPPTQREIEDLVRHLWIHAGYLGNGYSKMTARQRQLYDEITSRPA